MPPTLGPAQTLAADRAASGVGVHNWLELGLAPS
jgi:hypothetical protein